MTPVSSSLPPLQGGQHVATKMLSLHTSEFIFNQLVDKLNE